MADLECLNCKVKILEGHPFCGSCGQPAAGGDEIQLDNETLLFGVLQIPGRAKLVLIKGEGGDGISYALNATDHLAGRSSGVIIFPDDNYLSREHANFTYRDNQLILVDLGSLNGAYIRIREPVYLIDGDFFCCGEQVLRVEVLENSSDYFAKDGTLYFISPNRKERLRITQVLDGGTLGRVVSSAMGKLTIGRQGCDLNIPEDKHLSRRNSKIVLQRDGRILLSDLGSKNGTFVRIRKEAPLSHGDYIFLGKELLRVEIIE